MANVRLFDTKKAQLQTDAKNTAGGRAYSMSDKHALAQYAVTGMFGGTYYSNAKTQLAETLRLAQGCDSAFIAKLAVYSRQAGFMKDMPALLLAILTARKENDLLRQVFFKVVDNGRMLRNYVQIVRSGVTGRKSLGSAPKRLIKQWLAQRTDEQIFRDSVGNDPSLADVVKMVHPTSANPAGRAGAKARENLYGYLIGQKYDGRKKYPQIVKDFEDFKKGKAGNRTIPDAPFQMLDSAGLESAEWAKIARNAKWHMTRMNLNTFKRHGVLDNKSVRKIITDRLRSERDIKQAKVFPYQVFTAYMNTQDLGQDIKDALHDAVEVAIDNVPSIEGKVLVGVDCSGSMGIPINGHGRVFGSGRGATCVDVAGLIASSIVRKNSDAEVYSFDTTAKRVNLDARDTVLTNTQKLNRAGGGTDMASVLRTLNKQRAKGDLVVLISDNESWATNYNWYRGTGVSDEWKKFLARNPKAQLVCIDLTPGTTTQVQDRKNALNVGGFSDQVFTVIKAFMESGGNPEYWVQKIEEYGVL